MRRNIKNDKVIKAITIGLAPMIAATSAPIDALADTEPEVTGEPATSAPADPAQTPATGGDTQPTTVTDDQTSAATADAQTPAPGTEAADFSNVEGASEAISEAATIAGEITEAKNALTPAVGETSDAFDQASLAKLEDASTIIKDTQKTLTEGVEAVSDAVETLDTVDESKITALTGKESIEKNDNNIIANQINALKKSYDKNENDPEHGRDNKELWHNETKSFVSVQRDENNNFVYDNNGNPKYKEQKELALICDEFYNNSYKVAADEIKKAMKNGLGEQDGDTWAANIQKLIDDAQAVLDENPNKQAALAASLQAIDDAIAEAEKAADVDVSNFSKIKDSIKDSKAFESALKEAESKAAVISTIRDKEKKFTDMFYEKYARDNSWGTGGGDVMQAGRKMMEDMVKYDLCKDGTIDPKTVKINWTKENGGFRVSYTDSEGNKQDAGIYNYVIKPENQSTPEDGVSYLGKYDETTKSFVEVEGFDYDRLTVANKAAENNDKAVDKIKEASENYKTLKSDVNALAKVADSVKTKVTTLKNIANLKNNGNYKFLKNAVVNTVKARENSQKALNDIIELFNFLKDRFEIVTPEPEVENPIEEENVNNTDPTPETPAPAADTDDTTADTTDDGAGTGGDTVIDGGDVSVTIPGGFTLPAGLLDAVAPTGGTASGVLGVRTGGGTEAYEGGAADSRTNVAPRADFGTVNKVLGSRQNKDNSQLVKKIKDNEIPLADIPNMDDEVKMNWWWLLIIFLLGATGKKMYDEYKKKKEAEEAAKINK